MRLQIRRLSYTLGAEIIGIDIRQPLDDQSVSEIHAAFLEHCILLFRGQPLTREQHIAFSRRFGRLEEIADYRVKVRIPEYPEISLVTNQPRPGKSTKPYAGDRWHSDLSNTCVPAMASLLRGVEVPEIGGDTMFANMYLAYETLSDGMKKLIEGLECIHSGPEGKIDHSTPERAAETRRLNTVAQPLVRRHPETGRKALYVGEQKVKQIVGMTIEESKPLIQFLCQHAGRPQFVYRHQWRKDDLIMWDNRCTNHIAVNDYDKTQIRHMERTTVMGTPSGYVYEGPLQ